MAGALAGKAALVTGSTSGIGLAVARALAGAGAAVALNGFGDPKEIEGLRSGLEKHGVKAVHLAADLARPQEAERLVREAQDALGRVDILVNNAAVRHVARVESFPPEKWDEILAVNLTACFRAIRAVLPGMRERGWGRIINVASAHGLVASPEKSAYVASKHGLIGLTKAVALETARTGVTCNAICPGQTLTPAVREQVAAVAEAGKLTPEQAKHRLLEAKQPSLEFVMPEHVGALAAFLCSDAASQIRGAALSIDGGWTAQ